MARSAPACSRELLLERLDDDSAHVGFVRPALYSVYEADVAVPNLVSISVCSDESAGHRYIVEPQRTADLVHGSSAAVVTDIARISLAGRNIRRTDGTELM